MIRRAVQPFRDLISRAWTRGAAVFSGLGYGRTVGVVTALGAAIRVAGLARQPLGYDEDFTALVVHQPLGRMFDIVSRDSAPPLFYVLERMAVAAADVLGLAGWGGPGGPVVLRVVPALAGIAAIPLLAALARRVGGDSAGVWAALFAALVPTAVMLSGFVRMYGLGATLTVASALLLWRAVDKSTTVRWLTYFAAAATAAWTDYFCVIALAGIVAAALWLRRGRRVSALAIATTTAAVATLAPWLLVAQAQFQHAGQGFWVPPLSFSMIGGTYCQLFMGPPIDWAIPFGLPLVGLQFAAVLAGSAALAYSAVAWRRLPAERRRGAIYLLIASGGVAILAIASVWRPVLDARYAGVMWLPLFALAGVGLAAMPRRYATLLLLAVTVPTLALSTVTTHRQTSELVPELDARVGTHDLAAAAWDHYLILLDETSPAVQSRLHVLSTTELPWYVGTAAYPEGAAIDTIPADVIAGHGRIFWIADPGVPAPVLPAGYRQSEVSCAIEVCLTIYEPPAG